jgi:hypothetical protein
MHLDEDEMFYPEYAILVSNWLDRYPVVKI